MKSLLPALLGLAAVASPVLGSTNVNYTASADPNSNPDANGNTLNVWTLTHGGDVAGNSNTYYGSYYATGGGILSTAWAIYANHGYTTTATSAATAATSEADQTAAFPGGGLNIGQTMSIDFLANSVDTFQQYGLRLTNTGNANPFVLSLSFVGGDGGYRYYDATTSGNSPFGYQGNGFHFAYTQTSATTYTVVATPIGGGAAVGTFSGTVNSAPNTIQIYNQSAGSNNNVLTNNFAIVPEPGSLAFAGAGLGLTVLCLRHRRVRRIS